MDIIDQSELRPISELLLKALFSSASVDSYATFVPKTDHTATVAIGVGLLLSVNGARNVAWTYYQMEKRLPPISENMFAQTTSDASNEPPELANSMAPSLPSANRAIVYGRQNPHR